MRAAEYLCNACDPKTLTVRQVMEDAVFTVSPETKGTRIAEILTEGNFGSVPVVDEDRTLVGLVSEFDLLRVMDQGENLRQVTASEMMTRDVVTATEQTPVPDVVKLLQKHHLIRVPVVENKKLVGMVARRDVVFGYVKATANYWP
jgi:CBS domain-containing protein